MLIIVIHQPGGPILCMVARGHRPTLETMTCLTVTVMAALIAIIFMLPAEMVIQLYDKTSSMKNKLSIILLCAIMQMVTLAVLGQQNHLPTAESINKGSEIMKSSLKLTDEQVVKLQEVNKQFISDLSRINQSADNNLAKSKQRKELLLRKEEEIKKIFTQAQYQQYRSMVNIQKIQADKELKKRMDSRKGG
jgi:hypothetical protein